MTGPQNVALAIDARTGRQIWRYRRELPNGLTACCGLVNRGFGVLGDKLFMTTLDAHLLALDLHTGKLRWDVTVADYRTGYAITVAPLEGSLVTLVKVVAISVEPEPKSSLPLKWSRRVAAI